MQMNVIGVGTDIVEVLRIAKMIERHGELFLTRVFTAREIEYCSARKAATQHYAGRWAGKEAILKALGTGWARGIQWRDMEIRNDGAGKPRLALAGGAREVCEQLGIADIMISISHCRSHATAFAVALSAPHHSDDPLS
jgi:holo-[acyl-carrier protein] synthase